MIGAWGERKIVNRLGLINLFGKNGKILRNVYIPKEDGSTTEIDALYITTKALFSKLAPQFIHSLFLKLTFVDKLSKNIPLKKFAILSVGLDAIPVSASRVYSATNSVL